MFIELSSEEAATLSHVVEERLQELRREIWHTDGKDYKVMLQDLGVLLESILEKLAGVSRVA